VRANRSNLSLRLIAAVALVAATAAAPATEVQLALDACPSCTGTELIWGALSAGVEVGAGRVCNLDWRRGATISLHTSADLSDTQSIEFHLCLNRDDLQGYAPSAGEQHCRKAVRREAAGWQFRVAPTEWQAWSLTSADKLLTVHYHRLDSEYAGATLWTWDEHHARAPERNELYPVGRDDFGLVFQLDTGQYGAEPADAAESGIGLLPRRDADWGQKDGGDRMWQPALGREVYLIQDDNRIYQEKPDVSPKVRRVTLDAERHLTIRFSHRLPVADWTPDKFRISTSAGRDVPVRAVYPFRHRGDDCALYSIEAAEPFDFPNQAYALDVAGFGTINVEVGHIVKDPSRFYAADAQLGATYTPEHTTFRVFAPGALTAWTVVADTVSGADGATRHVMRALDKGLWEVQVSGDLAGKYYAYALGGIGFDPDREITDPYAVCTQARHDRALIVDLRATDPEGFRDHVFTPPASPADAIIYEMHVRDFTIAPDSGVQHKGKYLGFAEGGTTLPDDPTVRTCLDHLVELGVTHLQLMPVQDFDNHETPDDGYNWGYMPVHFNAPDGWFAAQAMGPGKITELKRLIQALHARGIGVILDVVYNHTADWAPFEKLVPGYYFRLTDAGNFSNGSGCGNEFASENPMARKFLLDSVKYWVREYKIDGFRFDLMGLIDLETMKQVKAELAAIHPGVLVYGEPWTAGHTPLRPITDQEHVRGTGIGAFNDHFRDAIKGDRDGGAPGFIQTGDRVGNVVKGLMGAVHDWAQDPVDALAYFEAHDNLTTWDKLLQTVPHASDELRRRMMRFAALSLFTAQGTIFMHGGQELCRSKQGNSNSYNATDEINRIDWYLKKRNADVVAYYQGLIALRKAHPAFRLRTRAEVEQRVRFDTPPNPRSIVYRIESAGVPGESAGAILVLLNGATEPADFALPKGKWFVHADAFRAGPTALAEAATTVNLPAHSGMLLLRE